MELNEAQALAEQAIYDYTSSTKWQQVKYMTWTTAEMQDVIAKALVKNIEVIQCCTELKDKEAMTFDEWTKENNYRKVHKGYARNQIHFGDEEMLQRYNYYKRLL